MKRTTALLVSFALVAVGTLASLAAAAPYPDRAIQIVAPANPGGGWDLTARATAKTLQELGLVRVPVTVVNQPGGFGAVAIADVINNRRKDPYVLVTFSTVLTTQMALGNIPFTYHDVKPVAALFIDYGVIGVANDSPYKSIQDLLEAIRKAPESVSFAGSSPPGGLDHIRVALLAKEAGVQPNRVRYVAFQGGADALAAVLGKDVTAFVGDAGEIAGYTEAGSIRPLVVLSPQRLPGFYAGVPSTREVGLGAVVSGNWRGFYAPPEVPQEVLEFWRKTFEQMVNASAWQSILQQYSWQPFFLTGDQFQTFLNDELNTYRQVLRELGVRR